MHRLRFVDMNLFWWWNELVVRQTTLIKLLVHEISRQSELS